jgi:hypothetical protein
MAVPRRTESGSIGQDAGFDEAMSEVFRVGVAGVGAIGRNHARIMAELAAASAGKVQFAAIYDVDQARAEELAAQYFLFRRRCGFCGSAYDSAPGSGWLSFEPETACLGGEADS